MGFDPADLDELVELLKIAGVRSAGVALADLNPPAVWVQLADFGEDLLSGDATYRVDLVLVVPDAAPRRALAELHKLYDYVRPVIGEVGGPAGRVRSATVLPLEGGPLPALVAPITMTGTTTPDP